jgi:hypothetical protein
MIATGLPARQAPIEDVVEVASTVGHTRVIVVSAPSNARLSTMIQRLARIDDRSDSLVVRVAEIPEEQPVDTPSQVTGLAGIRGLVRSEKPEMQQSLATCGRQREMNFVVRPAWPDRRPDNEIRLRRGQDPGLDLVRQKVEPGPGSRLVRIDQRLPHDGRRRRQLARPGADLNHQPSVRQCRLRIASPER